MHETECFFRRENNRNQSYFSSHFLGGHFKSRFETKYLNPVINNRHLLIKELQENPDNQSIAGTEQTNRVRSMIAYINQHYPEKITLASLGKSSTTSFSTNSAISFIASATSSIIFSNVLINV